MGDSCNLPLPCAKGCGFYGSKETKNLCSKCYNDFLIHLLSSEVEAKLKVAPPCTVTATSAAPSRHPVSVDSSSSDASSPPKLKNRCESCNKKVGLMGFSCRCGKVFCGFHRYPNEHSCNFDFKSADRLILTKENPLLKDDKLESRI